MKNLKRLVLSRTVLFMLLAILAVTLMGTAFSDHRYSDLHKTALRFAGESSGDIRSDAPALARRNPGALLRANTRIK